MLSPNFCPITIPAQKARIFFNAPPNSAPFTSSDVYILRTSFINVSCTSFNKSLCFEAITNAVGIPIDTSSAWLGPESPPILEFGSSSSTTSFNVYSVSFSNPFEHIIIS